MRHATSESPQSASGKPLDKVGRCRNETIDQNHLSFQIVGPKQHQNAKCLAPEAPALRDLGQESKSPNTSLGVTRCQGEFQYFFETN